MCSLTYSSAVNGLPATATTTEARCRNAALKHPDLWEPKLFNIFIQKREIWFGYNKLGHQGWMDHDQTTN